jgi:hypothetical protein
LLWPIFKSNVAGSELAADGPIVKQDIPIEERDLLTIRAVHQNNGEQELVLKKVPAAAG